MQPILEILNLCKSYRIGRIGSNTIRDDIQKYWHKLCNKDVDVMAERNVLSSTQHGDWISAIKDITCSIYPGERIGIIGSNGAGKSTLLKILSRITTPTSGEVIVRGKIAGLLEVNTGFHPEFTGRENIYLSGLLLGMKRKEVHRHLDEIVEFAGVSRYLDTPVKRYSSGMKVRLGFAIASYLEPDIMIVDEVLAVGDADFRKKAINKMHENSSRDKRTILFVSHNLEVIRGLCSRCLVMQQGELTFDGDTDNAIRHYLGDNVAATHSLSEVTRTISNKMMQIDNMKLFNEDGDEVTKLAIFATYKLSLNLMFFKDVAGLEFVVFFRNHSDEIVTTMECRMPFDTQFNTNIRSCIDFVWQNPLSPGTYKLEATAYLQGQKIEQVEKWFAVKDLATTGEISSRGGVFHIPYKRTYDFEYEERKKN